MTTNTDNKYEPMEHDADAGANLPNFNTDNKDSELVRKSKIMQSYIKIIFKFQPTATLGMF